MDAVLIVIGSKCFELMLEIGLAPEEHLIQIFSPDGPDESLNEGMRNGSVWDTFDFLYSQYSKIGSPLMRVKNGVIVCTQIFRQNVSCDDFIQAFQKFFPGGAARDLPGHSALLIAVGLNFVRG